MALGTGIFLLALGAILTFAVEVDLAGLNIDVVGIILMIAGIIGILLELTLWGPRRREVIRDRY
jgi:uncharacterized membrane protein